MSHAVINILANYILHLFENVERIPHLSPKSTEIVEDFVKKNPTPSLDRLMQ